MDYASQAVNSKVCYHIWEHWLSCYEYQLVGNENLLGRNSFSFSQLGYWNFVFIDCAICIETFSKVDSSRIIITDHRIVVNVSCHIKFIVWCVIINCISVCYCCSCVRVFRTLKHTMSSTRYCDIAM